MIVWSFIAPSHALGLMWKHITSSDDGLTNFYMDINGVVVQGSIRRVRLLFDFSQVQQDPDTLIEHRSVVEVASIDCRHHSLAPIEATSYSENMGRGRTVLRSAPAQPRPVIAASASIDERVIDFACKVRR